MTPDEVCADYAHWLTEHDWYQCDRCKRFDLWVRDQVPGFRLERYVCGHAAKLAAECDVMRGQMARYDAAASTHTETVRRLQEEADGFRDRCEELREQIASSTSSHQQLIKRVYADRATIGALQRQIRHMVDQDLDQLAVQVGPGSATQRTVEALQERADGIDAWLKEIDSLCKGEQRHTEEGAPESVYWHYGYMVALRDVIKKLAALTPGAAGEEQKG